MFKLLVCKVIFNATNCAQQMGESASLYNSACRYLHFCHSSFGHLSTHLQVKVVFLQGNIDFWASLYQLTAYCTFLTTCLQDCGEFEVDTYTRISCAGCLCLAASSHHETWVQSSFSLLRNAGRELCMTGEMAVTTPTNNNTHKYPQHPQISQPPAAPTPQIFQPHPVGMAGIFVGDMAVAILDILRIRHPPIQGSSFGKLFE